MVVMLPRKVMHSASSIAKLLDSRCDINCLAPRVKMRGKVARPGGVLKGCVEVTEIINGEISV
jgi:hypothetical protein